MNINRISQNITKGTKSFVTGLGKGDAFLPIVLLEGAVIAGRTYHAYDRGGFIEARERGTEEVLGAVFWLGGVQVFNKMGDIIGKKLMGVPDVDFEVGKDFVRNPLKNYIKKTAKYGEKTLALFKFTKITASVLLANAIIGFVVPKINQSITEKYQKSAKKSKLEMNVDGIAQKTLPKIKKKEINKAKDTPSFEGGAQALLSLTNSFESDARYKVISTDFGIAGGRAINARNKHERREILFRDLSSIYFYVFCSKHLGSVLNFLEDGKLSRLDPVSADVLNEHLQSNFKDKKVFSAEEFERAVYGEKGAKIPNNVQDKIRNGIIKLDDFRNAAGSNSVIAKRAELMSQLQPKVEGVSILTTEQVKDVYNGGLINNPEFLNKAFNKYTNNKSTNPMMFVADKDLRTLKQQMAEYVENIAKKAKARGEDITLETLKKANKTNFAKNLFNHGVGFGVAAYFLSTAIPKIQYWITEQHTGANKFPGVEKYDKK